MLVRYVKILGTFLYILHKRRQRLIVVRFLSLPRLPCQISGRCFAKRVGGVVAIKIR